MKNPHMPCGLHLRPSRPGDAPFIEALHRSLRSDLQWVDAEQGFIDELVNLQFRAQAHSYAARYPNAMYWIVERHGQAIGKVTLDFSRNLVHLIELGFIAEARAHGYGRAVIESIQKTSAEVGAPMSLSVMTHNLPAKRLYAALGFVVEQVIPPYESLIWYPPARAIAVGV